MSRCIAVSSDNSEIRITEQDREFARKVLARDAGAIASYAARNRWSDRAEALVFIEALRENIVSENFQKTGFLNQGIDAEFSDRILTAYSEIANTNAQPKYVLDRLILFLYSQLSQ